MTALWQSTPSSCYEVYQNGKCIYCVAVRLDLVSSIYGDALTYQARVAAFMEGGPHSYDGVLPLIP